MNSNETQKRVVAIVSGGMDSVTLVYYLHGLGYDVHALSFNYGQRHKKELEFAALCCERLAIQHDIIDLSSVGALLKGSALTDDIAVPHGHYAEDSMKITVVPNRNAIMLAIAFGVAVSDKAVEVATGVHAGDHFVYPDCRPDFITTFNTMQVKAVEGFAEPGLRLNAPFLHLSKSQIAIIGNLFGVPFEDTWSCYEGGETHCGKCGTCVERKEAMREAHVTDRTVYQA